MEQIPSSEANKLAASQEILRILWKPKFITTITSFRHFPLSWAILV
jgi:hypothetical protein